MDKIKERLLKNKPNLSKGSLITYESYIKNLMLKLGKDDLDILRNYKYVLENTIDYTYGRRASVFSAIINYLGPEEDEKILRAYKKALLDDNEKVKDEQIKQTKSENQKENWKSYKELLEILENLKYIAKPLLKKTNINNEEYEKIQDYLIASLYLLIPPRRLLDYTEFKIKNIDPKKDNYLDKNFLVFNQYKTNKWYGEQKVEIPKNLKSLLKKFISISPYDYLLVDTQQKKMYPSKLNQRLHKIFKKKISVNMLRHIYISDNVLKDMPKLENLQEIARNMGHNFNEQILYKKF